MLKLALSLRKNKCWKYIWSRMPQILSCLQQLGKFLFQGQSLFQNSDSQPLLKTEKEESHLSINIAMSASQLLHIFGKLTLVAKLQLTQLITQVLQLKIFSPPLSTCNFFPCSFSLALLQPLQNIQYKISSTNDLRRKAIIQ